MTDNHQFALQLGPNVRLRMTVAEEMRLDTSDEVFTDDLQAKYVSMHQEADRQQQNSLKGLVLADIGLALLLFGKNVKIPGTDLGIQDIPAAIEVLTVAAAFYFLVLCQAFANTQCYHAIIEEFSNRRALKLGIDPDYLTYGSLFSHVYLKAFRTQMNVFGPDFFVPKKRYRTFYGIVMLLLILSWVSILLMHVAVVAAGAWNSIGSIWLWWPFAVAIVLLHLTGVVMNLFLNFDFDVHPRADVQEARRLAAEQRSR